MIQRVGSRYHIVKSLDKGGMGLVYKATDTRLMRTVALKFLPPELTGDAALKERFIFEARAASALEHVNICTIHDISETDDGQLFIVMSYYDGESLSKKILGSPLDVEQAIGIAIQVAEGMAAAHKRGIVHRDLKPDNIMITAEGVAKIIDFGLARIAGISKMTQPSFMLGTVTYMSPEQARGYKVDHRTDIWSLGVVLYEMLIGHPPFRQRHAPATIYSILHEAPEPIANLRTTVPEALERVVSKLLAKEMGERYQTMDDVSTDLRGLPTESPARATDDTISMRQRERDAGSIQSLVVLPLVNLSNDPGQEYFADGMTDALTTSVAKIRPLKVISRTSAMCYKGTTKSLPQIADELKVEGVLEGSVMRSGQRVRVSVQLIHAHTDTHVWAENYERDVKDVLILQSELTRAIAREIKGSLTQRAEKRFATARAINPDAYDAYLAGCFHFNTLKPEHFDKALEYYALALEKEPNYALAHVGIANAWLARGYWGVMAPKDCVPMATKAVLEALDLDDLLEEAHDALARLRYWSDWNWDGAEIEFRRAIQLNPSYAYAHLFYSAFLRSVGRGEAALLEAQQGLELDPVNHFTQVYFVGQLLHMHMFREVIERLRKILISEPHFPMAHRYLWVAYHRERIYEKAMESATRYFASLGKNDIADALKQRYAASGYEGAMCLVAEMLEQSSKKSFVQPIWIARLYAHGGNIARALDWLETAFHERDFLMVNLRASNDWENLRTHPRFLNLLNRMKFPEPVSTTPLPGVL